MKKAPVKVLIRMRPTSNFAHHNMHVDEETGYPYINAVTSKFMLIVHLNKVSSIINKTNGDLSSRKYYQMLHKNSCSILVRRKS